MFELVYKQNIPPAQPYMGQNLIIRGTNVENLLRCKIENRKNTKKRKSSNGSPSSEKSNLKNRCSGKRRYSDLVQNKKNRECVVGRWEKFDDSVENKENLKNNNCRINRRLRKNSKNAEKPVVNLKFVKPKVPIAVKNDRRFPFVNRGSKRKSDSSSLPTKVGDDENTLPKII